MKSGLTVDRVINLHLNGDLPGAEQGYRILISENVEHPLVYLNLAAICLTTGRTGEALELLQASLRLDSNNPAVYLNFSCAFMEQGRLEDAIASCQRALDLNPTYAEAHHNLGRALQELGRWEDAISSYQKAIELSPEYSRAFYNLGNILIEHGKVEDAISSYRRAIELNPNYSEAYLNLGTAFGDNFEEAIACYLKAIEVRPDYPEAYNNLGNALLSHGEVEDAALALRRATELRPDYADAYYNLGLVYQEQRNAVDADRCFRKAIELKHSYAEAYDHLGFALRQQDEPDEAIASYRKALELRTDHLEKNDLVRRVGGLLSELERLPVIYKETADIDKHRDHFISCLNEASWLVSNEAHTFTAEERDILKGVLFRVNNFYLAYQQLNDKELQISYSRLASNLLSHEMAPYFTASKVSHSKTKIRLGIASAYLGNHNGSFWAYNWLANLPREDYEFFLYSLQGRPDHVTKMFAALGTYRWLPFRETDYLESLRIVREDNLDVLLLPDVGMSPQSRIISLARLAPIQCVSWGHPVTTGSPNIDYYLSSELMETAEADSHYSEQLIRLPNTGMHFDHPVRRAETLSRADFGIPNGRIGYGSVQSLFKYLPQFDFVYPAIARQVPDAFFIFVGSQTHSVTTAFRERLRNEFEQAGLSFEKYVKILPQLPFTEFMQLLCALDINLDSIGWSGGISTLNSLAMNCPVVTLPGEFMRGRHSYAMLKMMGVEDLIANSLDEYISLSVRIGLDASLRSDIVEKIKAQKHRLFNDKECTEYLDRFLKSKVAEVRANSGPGVAELALGVRNSTQTDPVGGPQGAYDGLQATNV